jgi:hypothetical protein
MELDGSVPPSDAGTAQVDGASASLDGKAPAPVDGSVAPAKVVSTISPYDPSGTLVYPTPIDWSLASDVPADIRFTLDGTAPTATSAGGPGPITVSKPPGGTKIRWTAGADPTVHEFLVGVDSSLNGKTTAYAAGFTFNGVGSHIVVATPGQSLTLHVADAWEWNSATSCPGCVDQLKFGFDKTLGCVLDMEPNPYPGAHVSNTALQPSFQAPTTPGVYDVHLGFEQNYHCSDTIGHGLGTTVVATVIVH